MNVLRNSCALLLVVGFSITGLAHEYTSVNVNRDDDGNLTSMSLENIRLLERIIAERGYIELWLTTRLAFNPNEDELTPAQIALRDERVRIEFDLILRPLIASGTVWSNPRRPEVEGPGISIRANAHGLARLIGDTRIRNMHYSE